LLTQPDAVELGRAYAVLKALHGKAFGWQPPDVAGVERLSATVACSRALPASQRALAEAAGQAMASTKLISCACIRAA